jgi:cob(I)alamin adenosyltransferase
MIHNKEQRAMDHMLVDVKHDIMSLGYRMVNTSGTPTVTVTSDTMSRKDIRNITDMISGRFSVVPDEISFIVVANNAELSTTFSW